jgi:hypothetical protein
MRTDRGRVVLVRLVPSLDRALKERGERDQDHCIRAAVVKADLEAIRVAFGATDAAALNLKVSRSDLTTHRVRLPLTLHKKCEEVALVRGITVNELCNAAVAHWLAAGAE